MTQGQSSINHRAGLHQFTGGFHWLAMSKNPKFRSVRGKTFQRTSHITAGLCIFTPEISGLDISHDINLLSASMADSNFHDLFRSAERSCVK